MKFFGLSIVLASLWWAACIAFGERGPFDAHPPARPEETLAVAIAILGAGLGLSVAFEFRRKTPPTSPPANRLFR